MDKEDLPEDWDDYMKEMFQKLFGKLPEEIEGSSDEELDELKDKLLGFLDKYESGDTSMADDLPSYDEYGENKSSFVQDLSDKDATERFRKFIKDYDMELCIEFIIEDGADMVRETWTNFDGSINITKVYEYNNIVLDELSSDIQMKIYEQKLEISVEKEQFEEAALIRDRINNLKDNSDS